MKKKLLLTLLSLGLSTQIFAEEVVNLVQQVSVNRLSLSQNMSYTQAIQILGKPKAKPQTEFAGCVGDVEVSMKFDEKTASLGYFKKDNLAALFKKPFNYQDSRLKGGLFISWDSVASLTETVMLDNWKVPSNLSFEEFKKRFPLSAKNPLEVEKNGAVSYAVSFGMSVADVPKDLVEVGYTKHVFFTFRGNKLVSLGLSQGIVC